MSEATITINVRVSGPELEITVDDPNAEVAAQVEQALAPESTPRIRRAASWRRRAADVDPGDPEAELLEILREIGEDRAECEREHKAAVDAMHEVKEEALARGIPMARISELMGVSRQWLYKMGEFAGREKSAA